MEPAFFKRARKDEGTTGTPLFAEPGSPPPHNGTPTSRLAAELLQRSGADVSQKNRIMFYLIAHGSATRDELEAKLGIRINAVCGRIGQLIDEGLVIEHGDVRTGRSGVPGKIVEPTDEALRRLEEWTQQKGAA